MLYVTLIISSNRHGDLSSHPLILRIRAMVISGVLWCYFLPTKFCGCAPHKSRHPFSPSLPLSPLRQLSCLKAQTIEQWPSHTKESVLPELPCPHQLEPSNHTREPSPHIYSTSAPTFRARGCQFFQSEDMMEQMSPIHVVSSPPIVVQVVPCNTLIFIKK
jgi:hypothetical protein